MSHKKALMLATGVLVTALTGSNAHAVNCSISYYCYRSMTPGPAPESSQALTRRTVAAANRVARVTANNRRAPVTTQPATNRNATPRTQEQRQAEARRREQQQQQRLAAQRRRAQQLEQQRQAELQRRRQQAQQAANRTQNNPPPANDRERLIAAQRNAYQAEQRRQQAATDNRPTSTIPSPAQTPARPSILTSISQLSPSQQSCQSIEKKITELNRQAILHSRNQQRTQAQRLFKAVEQLKKEAQAKKCPNIT